MTPNGDGTATMMLGGWRVVAPPLTRGSDGTDQLGTSSAAAGAASICALLCVYYHVVQGQHDTLTAGMDTAACAPSMTRERMHSAHRAQDKLGTSAPAYLRLGYDQKRTLHAHQGLYYEVVQCTTYQWTVAP